MTFRLLIATATLMYAVGAPLVLPTPVAAQAPPTAQNIIPDGAPSPRRAKFRSSTLVRGR